MLEPTQTLSPGCPGADELSDFFDGRLDPPRSEVVAEHVETCDTCLSTLSALVSSDPLIKELRKKGEAEPISAQEAASAVHLARAVSTNLAAALTRTGGDTAAAPHAGGTLGPYDLLELLGEGGMGQVFRARHRVLGRDVAVKLIHPGRAATANIVARFEREIQLLARLDHPNIVRADHADVFDGVPCLVMEYVPGVSLSDVVKREGKMPVAQAVDVIRQAASALQYAHEKGLVHRDIKPSNLLLTPDGVVKLLDLGLARHAGVGADELTASGQLMGTFDYMAPEQWDDSHAVDIRADIYSLGCTLYFLLAGRAPFGEPRFAGQMSKMKAHALVPPPPLTEHRTDAPAALSAIVARMLAKAPDERFQTPGEVARALETFQVGGVVELPHLPAVPTAVRLATDESRTDFAARPVKRRRSGLRWLIGGLVVMGVTCLGVPVLGFLAFALMRSSASPRNDASVMIPSRADEGILVGHPTPAPTPFDPSPRAKEILTSINRARQKREVPPLKVNDQLKQAAQQHAENMACRRQLEHEFDGKSVSDRLRAVGYVPAQFGEKILRGEINLASQEMLATWVKAPAEQELLMQADVTEVGIGIARCDQGEAWYALVFAKPK